MAHPMGEATHGPLRVDFDRRLKLEFHGSKVTSDGGLLAYRELGDALGLKEAAAGLLQDGRRGQNGWHAVVGMLRLSVLGLLAGCEDVNDADLLSRDPAMRWLVGGKATDRGAESSSQMGRFETQWLTADANLAALGALSGAWIDRVHCRKPTKLMKIGAKVTRHGRYVTLQLAEVAVPRDVFATILDRIDRLRPRPAPT